MQTTTAGGGMKPTVLQDNILNALRSARVEDNRLYLPPNMDAKLYKETDKVLKELDGKWTSNKGCHVFDGNPEILLRPVIETGVVYFAKKQDFFFTPEELIDGMLCWLELDYGMKVLEPNAGEGAIAVAVRDYFKQFVQMDLVEINPRLVGKLHQLGFTSANGYRVECRDFLTFQPGYLYDRVIMNPPFSSQIEQIRHAYSLLRSGGILTTIVSDALYTHSDRKTEEFWRDFRADVHIEFDNDDVLPNAFKASGTKVKTHTIAFIKD